MRKGEGLKTPRYASAIASHNDRIPYSRYIVKKLLVKRDY